MLNPDSWSSLAHVKGWVCKDEADADAFKRALSRFGVAVTSDVMAKARAYTEKWCETVVSQAEAAMRHHALKTAKPVAGVIGTHVSDLTGVWDTKKLKPVLDPATGLFLAGPSWVSGKKKSHIPPLYVLYIMAVGMFFGDGTVQVPAQAPLLMLWRHKRPEVDDCVRDYYAGLSDIFSCC
jgi:hypothetical protein